MTWTHLFKLTMIHHVTHSHLENYNISILIFDQT